MFFIDWVCWSNNRKVCTSMSWFAWFTFCWSNYSNLCKKLFSIYNKLWIYSWSYLCLAMPYRWFLCRRYNKAVRGRFLMSWRALGIKLKQSVCRNVPNYTGFIRGWNDSNMCKLLSRSFLCWLHYKNMRAYMPLDSSSLRKKHYKQMRRVVSIWKLCW